MSRCSLFQRKSSSRAKNSEALDFKINRDIDICDIELTDDDDSENECASPSEDSDENEEPVIQNRPAANRASNGTLIYFGVEEWMRKDILEYDRNVTNQQLAINCDGLQLFKKSHKCFWTILGQFEEGNVFPIAVYYGTGKPKY